MNADLTPAGGASSVPSLGAIDKAERKLLKDSCAHLFIHKGAVADLFYNKLFEIEPAYQGYFSNLHKQKIMFAAMLAYCMVGLISGRTVGSLTKRLKQYHDHLAISPRDIENAKQALLFALEETLGETLTQDQKEVWEKSYYLVSASLLAKS